jgi:hypothetical protein
MKLICALFIFLMLPGLADSQHYAQMQSISMQDYPIGVTHWQMPIALSSQSIA